MIQSKLKGEETIFTTMSRMAVQYNAINLGQGFPDFDPDLELIRLVNEAMLKGHNQYAPLRGVLSLREAIAEKSKFLYGTNVNPHTEVCITPGATYAIYSALTAILREDDEVIIFEPAYDSYIPNIIVNGAKPVSIPLSYPTFTIDWERVRAAITPRTRMIMINSPHNPSGTLCSDEDMLELTSIVNEHDLLVVSDEVYEPIVFDGMKHNSVLKYPELLQRSFVVFSFGKVYHCTGWKTGYCIAPQQLMEEFSKVHQYNVFFFFAPVQYALAEFMQQKEHYLGLGSFYQKRRDQLSLLLEQSGLKPLPSHGSFFQLFDYSALSNSGDLEFAIELTEKAGVSAIPVSPFYSSSPDLNILRFCFAKKESTLAEAGRRLKEYFPKMPNG